jgi:alcohol dehydrogenase class IV
MEVSFSMMNKLNMFVSPNRVILGNGAVRYLGEEAKKLGAKKALIVTGQGSVKADLIKSAEEPLRDQGITVGIFDKVEPEPLARIVDECAQLAQKDKYDIIIGLGGGSALDVAKGTSIVAANKGKILDYVGTDIVPRKGLPKILIPTSSGTGSEVTRVLVVTSESDNAKKVIFSDFNLADVAIVDPLLTVSMPLKITADSGMDALVHAIESYISVNATPFSDILAIEAIRLIAVNLPLAYAKAENIEARFKMSLAATLAGMCIASSSTGAVHALAYGLGTEYRMSHGRSNTVMLPYVVAYNKIGSLDKYNRIAQAMGENIIGLSPYEVVEKLVSCLFRLLEVLDIPVKLSAYGISRKDIPKLVEGGMKHSRLFVPNPRNLTQEDVENIYTNAL